MVDTHAYTLKECEGGNPVSARGVGMRPWSALPDRLPVVDTHAYILKECEGGNPVSAQGVGMRPWSALPDRLPVVDTHAYILKECEGGNPVSARGVVGNVSPVTVDLGLFPKSVKCSPSPPLLEVAVWPRYDRRYLIKENRTKISK